MSAASWLLVGCLAAFLFGGLYGCGETATPATPPSESAPESAPALPDPPPPERPVAIGWDHVPADPDAAARTANSAALRLHGQALGAEGDIARRIYEGSVLGFQRVADAHPDYLNARFNQACALARLGRHDESIAMLRTLLAIDLPSFGPRLDSDPDLASLPEAAGFAALQTYREALLARYTAALEAGVPVVHLTAEEVIPAASEDADEIHRTTYQAGVWLASERRFVPMAPGVVRSMDGLTADLGLTAIVVDRARGAVLQFVGTGTWSEGGGPIDEGSVVVFDVATGRERERRASRRPEATWEPEIQAHVTESGVALRFVREDAHAELLTLTEGAFDEAARPAIVASLAHASVLLPHGAPPEGVVLERNALVRGEHRVALADEHHFGWRSATRAATWVPRDANSAWLLTAVIQHIEWDSMDTGAVALSVVDVSDGALNVTLLDSVRAGVGALVAAPDGTAYAQLGDRVVHLTRDGVGEALPAGLHLITPRPGAY